MNSGHDEKFDGLFGDEGVGEPRPVRRAPLAGLFGLSRMALRQGDRKSPAETAKQDFARR